MATTAQNARLWTEDEDRLLIEDWNEGRSGAEIAARIDRTIGAVHARKRLLEERGRFNVPVNGTAPAEASSNLGITEAEVVQPPRAVVHDETWHGRYTAAFADILDAAVDVCRTIDGLPEADRSRLLKWVWERYEDLRL
jgi:hypothetical protein